MKLRLITLITMATIACTGMWGQNSMFSTGSHMSESTLNEALLNGPSHDMSCKRAKTQKLVAKDYLLINENSWSDGMNLLFSFYDDETHQVTLVPRFYTTNPEANNLSLTLNMSRSRFTEQGHTGHVASVERIGAYDMLVIRNAQGKPVKAFYHMTQEQATGGNWLLFLHYLLMGNYEMSNKQHVVFGPQMPFYSGDRYERDPGLFAYHIDSDFSTIHIAYGDQRVSHGDPSSSKYGRMPGGGGAGALMPPMEWDVRFTADGLEARVVKDHKFVDHNPALMGGTETPTTLTKVESPYEGIEGKWTFASVIPLTHQLLRLFPKEVLPLMRGEIYARHGDTFANPATQRYFDAQPWYKKNGKLATSYIIASTIKQIEAQK